MKNNLTLTLILLVLVGAVSFFAGLKYQEVKTAKTFSQRFVGNMGRQDRPSGQGNRLGGFRPINGEIIAKDDKSITVKLPDGGSKIVLFSDKTSINKADEAFKDDLKVGEKVAVFGQENADGSVSAQNIQLNPITRGLGQ